MRTVTFTAAAVVTLVAACTPANYAKGTWHFDGKSFGTHDSPNASSDYYERCSAGDDVGSIRFEIAVAHLGGGTHQFAHVTVSPLNEQTSVDVGLPWSHTTFARGDCSRLVSNVTPQPAAPAPEGWRNIRGSLQLACARDGNTVALDLAYVCPLRDR